MTLNVPKQLASSEGDKQDEVYEAVFIRAPAILKVRTWNTYIGL